MKKINFTDQQLRQIIKDYQENGISMQKIGNQFQVSKTVISRVLKENNIKINKDNHIYKADYDKFEIINTPEKAYWLGFIAADGCNYNRKTNATIKINIHQKDIKHLEKFRDFMNSNVNITTHVQDKGFSNHTPMCVITFNSLKMSTDLIDKGIVPNKSLILKPPKIDEKYWLPYILGYFDGDGSIYKTVQGTYGISFEGTKETLQWINNILTISNTLEKRNNNDKNNYYIRCGGINKPYQILKRLYETVDIHLDRKYAIYKNLETVVLNRNIE